MASTAGPHRRAVTRLLRATGLVHVPEEAPLVEYVKDLATQMDGAGGTRVQQAYLSALKDLRRVINAGAGQTRGTAEPSSAIAQVEGDVGEETPQQNDLARFKESRGIA
jgi:hypothetical protein